MHLNYGDYASTNSGVLESISTWSLSENSVFEFIQNVWNTTRIKDCAPPFPEVSYDPLTRRWVFETGGLVYNKELIEALRRNQSIWDACWESSNNRGQHVFKLPSHFVSSPCRLQAIINAVPNIVATLEVVIHSLGKKESARVQWCCDRLREFGK